MSEQPHRPMSLAEFLEFSERAPAGTRYEVVDGRPVVMPAPLVRHQVMLAELGFRLRSAAPPGLMVVPAPLDWVLWQVPTLTLRQPDLAVVERKWLHEPRLTEAPLLVAEVLSPSSRRDDTVVKAREYAKAGARHYWLADPDVPEITVLRLDAGTRKYIEMTRAADDQELAVEEPFPVKLIPNELLS